MQFIWRPYLGLEHQPNQEDMEIWTAKTAIIRFNVVEMHQSDRVKMQFGMYRNFPSDPTCLDPWHQNRVDGQWDIVHSYNFAPEFWTIWRTRAADVFSELIF